MTSPDLDARVPFTEGLAAAVHEGRLSLEEATAQAVRDVDTAAGSDLTGIEFVVSSISARYDELPADTPFRLAFATLVASIAQCYPISRIRGWTQHDLGKLLKQHGRYVEATDAFRRAVDEFQESFPEFVEVVEGDLGAVLRMRHLYRDAEPLLRRAVNAAIASKSLHNELEFRLELGNTLVGVSRTREALDVLREGLSRAGAEHARHRSAMLTAMANAYENEGNYDLSIDHHRRALELSRPLGAAIEAYDHQNLARLYGRLDRRQEAMDEFETALTLAKAGGDVAHQIAVLSSLGAHVLRWKGPAHAIPVLEDAVTRSERLDPAAAPTDALGNLATARFLAGDFATARALHERVLARSRQNGDHISVVEDLVNLARVSHALGDTNAEGEYAREALEVSTSIEIPPFLLSSAEWAVASAMANARHPDAAEIWRHYDAAMTAFERPREYVHADEDKVGLYSERGHALYEDAVSWLAAAGSPAQAFECAERAKSRLLLDGLAKRRRGGLSAPEPLEALLRRVTFAPRSTAFVSLFVTRAETLMFVAAGGADDVRLLRLAIPEEKWKTWLAAWMDLVRRMYTTHEHPAASRSAALDAVAWLHEAVTAPLLQAIASINDVSTLVLIPHRLLHGVPFHAAFDGVSRSYLAERFTISSVPALQMWERAPVVPSRRSLLTLSNPATSLPSLLWAEEEARAVSEMFGGTRLDGSDATVDAFLASAPDATMIHLGCHAEFNAVRPEQSALRLAHDERLTARQIASLRLPALQLVMTAACQSGRNRPGAIDEALGLPRAWLLAGARQVLSALWDVDDEATHRFVLAFYERVKSGDTLEVAYTQAQRTLLSGTPVDRDPRMWAAFVITSPTSPRESPEKESP